MHGNKVHEKLIFYLKIKAKYMFEFLTLQLFYLILDPLHELFFYFKIYNGSITNFHK